MYDTKTLLPPVEVIHDRLTHNQRERHRLRTLLRLARDAQRQDDTQASPKPDAADRKGVTCES